MSLFHSVMFCFNRFCLYLRFLCLVLCTFIGSLKWLVLYLNDSLCGYCNCSIVTPGRLLLFVEIWGLGSSILETTRFIFYKCQHIINLEKDMKFVFLDAKC